MPFLNFITKRLIKKYVRGCCRAMLISGLAFNEKHKGENRSYAWLAAQALSTRPRWQRVGEMSFAFVPMQKKIEIADDMSLKDVTEKVIRIELLDYVKETPPEELCEILDLGQKFFDEFYNKK